MTTCNFVRNIVSLCVTLLAFGAVSTSYGNGTLTGISIANAAQNLTQDVPNQPEGVSVTVEDGHAIIDFSERAESSKVAMQFVSPMGSDVEASQEVWEANIPDPLARCVRRCDMFVEDDEYVECVEGCWALYGSPTEDK